MTTWRAASTARSSRPRSPHGGVYLDIAWIKENFQTRRSTSKKIAVDVSPVHAAGESRYHTTPMDRADYALHHGRPRVNSDTQESTVPGLFPPVNAPRGSTVRIDLAKLPLRPDRLSANAPANTPRSLLRENAPVRSPRRSRRKIESCISSIRTRRRRESVHDPERSAGDDAGERRHRAH